MGRSKSKRSRSEGLTGAAEASESLEVMGEVAVEVEAPVVTAVEVGGDAKALASMFAMSGAVFGKKASYARAGEAPAPEKKPKVEQKEKKETVVEPKSGKKKEKKKQKLQQEKEEAAKVDGKKDRKKDKKKTKQQQPETVEEEEAAAEQGGGKKQKQKSRKLKQKEKKTKPTDGEQEEETKESPATDEDADESNSEVDAKEEKEVEAKEASKPVDEAKSRRTVFVGNVSLDASEKDVTRHFAPCGKVETVRLRNLPVAGCAVDQAGNQKLMMKVCANKKIFNDKRETCNAYVVFASEESVPAALALDGSVRELVPCCVD